MTNEQIIEAALNAACAAVQAALGQTGGGGGGAAALYFSPHNGQHRAFTQVMRDYVDFARAMQDDTKAALEIAYLRAQADLRNECNSITIAAYKAAQRALAAVQ